MSNTLHPVMAAAIAPFLKQPDMRHLRRIPPLESYTHKLNGVSLACEIEFEKGEKATRLEPGEPDSAILWSAKTESGDDVTELLSNAQREEIEASFLNQTEDY